MQILVGQLLPDRSARILLDGRHVRTGVELPSQRAFAGAPLVAEVGIRGSRSRSTCGIHPIVLFQPEWCGNRSSISRGRRSAGGGAKRGGRALLDSADDLRLLLRLLLIASEGVPAAVGSVILVQPCEVVAVC